MFQKALTHIENVGDPKVWIKLGNMYDLAKNNKAAEDAYNQVLQLDPEAELKAEALFSLSFVARLEKRLDVSVLKLQEVLAMDKDLWPSTVWPLSRQDIWFEIGITYREMERHDDEKKAFMQSQSSPDDPDMWHRCAA